MSTWRPDWALRRNRAAVQGFRYVVYGPRFAYPVCGYDVNHASLRAEWRTPAIEKFVRGIAEAMKILFLDKDLTCKVLAKQLCINYRKLLDAAYDEEIKVMEQRLEFKNEAFQAIIDETGRVDARAKKIKPQDLVDRRFLDAVNKSGFFEKLWAI